MPPSAADQLNGSPSRGTSLLGFRAPEPRPSNLPPSPEELTDPAQPVEGPSLPGLGEPEPDSVDGWPDERLSDPGDDTPTPTSSPASNPLAEAGLRDMFRGGVAIAGDQAHNFLARSEGAQSVGLYRTDEADQAAIGDPLARVAARREGVGEMSPDTADLLAAMVGLTRYATKQVNKRTEARAIDAGAAHTVQEFPAGAGQAVDL